ncbi:hypothetical protein AURDEDRAFT_168336 [Auricularia subglabra TFB-10046 SS5]|nr:hypothetical protein AURDEDRAFT_168336 [Auricularia subglabra TFB-10046 SS5]
MATSAPTSLQAEASPLATQGRPPQNFDVLSDAARVAATTAVVRIYSNNVPQASNDIRMDNIPQGPRAGARNLSPRPHHNGGDPARAIAAARHNGGLPSIHDRAVQSRMLPPPDPPQGRSSNVGQKWSSFEHGGKGDRKTHRGSRGGKGRDGKTSAQDQGNKRGDQRHEKGGKTASYGSWHAPPPSQSQQHGAGPSSSRGRPTLSAQDPARALMSALLNGPSRKRGREQAESSREHAPKRGRWEDDLDDDTRSWGEQLRRAAHVTLTDSRKLERETKRLTREIDWTRTAIEALRRDNRVLRESKTDTGNSEIWQEPRSASACAHDER